MKGSELCRQNTNCAAFPGYLSLSPHLQCDVLVNHTEAAEVCRDGLGFRILTASTDVNTRDSPTSVRRKPNVVASVVQMCARLSGIS